eukprot:11196660-Lingulodinium_polyedra.AAC.1
MPTRTPAMGAGTAALLSKLRPGSATIGRPRSRLWPPLGPVAVRRSSRPWPPLNTRARCSSGYLTCNAPPRAKGGTWTGARA